MTQVKKACQLISETYITEKRLAVFLCCMVLGFPILELIFAPMGLPFFFQETFLVQCGLLLLIVQVLKWLGTDERRFCLSDCFLIASAAFAVLSIVTSLDISQSLHGQPNYSETPLQTLGYFMAFLACSQIREDSNRKKILYALGGMFLMEMIVGTIQKLQLWPWPAVWGQSRATSPGVAYGLTENSNFYGAICVLAVGFFSSLYLFGSPFARSKKQPVIAYLLAVWSFLCALFSNARLAWVGVAGEVVLFLFLDILMKRKFHRPVSSWKRICLLFLTFLLVFVLFFSFDPVLSKRKVSVQRDVQFLQDLAAGEMDTSALNHIGSNRGYHWRVCLHAWMQRPILGVGFDNLRYAYTMFSDPEMKGLYQDKAHNEYLHYLTTQGLFSCLNYLSLCCYVTLHGLKVGCRKFSEGLQMGTHLPWIIQLALLIMAFGYFSQALFDSSVTNIAIYKWIIMGLVLSKSEQKALKPRRRSE